MKTTIELVHGLPQKELIERIFFHQRQGEVADRALGFYLLEMQRRKAFRPYDDAAHWAQKRLGRERADKLILLAKRLEELPEIDSAFSEGEVPWTKVRELCLPPSVPPRGRLGSRPPRPSGSGWSWRGGGPRGSSSWRWRG